MNRTADTENLAGLVQIALGTAVPVTGIQRLRGGSKKGVYRVHLGGPPTSVMVYSWAQEENFWPRATDAPDPGDPFAAATGLPRLLAATHELQTAGVRSPRVLWSDDSHQHYPADVAVIEDVPAGSLETLMDTDPARAETVLHDLAASLTRLHARTTDHYGPLGHLENYGTSCEQMVLQRARGDLDEGARRDERLRAAHPLILQRLHDLHDRVRPRQKYSLIHGELGPDHVLVDTAGQSVLIDIEGLMFFDIEWEHAFLELRFHDRYTALAVDALDEDRLRLYRLAMRLSLVTGPLRLLDGDFPDRTPMQHIAEHNLQMTLALIKEPMRSP
ncbi:aminoglycoside phosphotransferase family protein [Kineosporia sp. NBRC 101731]|uniref:aminoglycoside phosphotransferase family protein n=1 Tax=Kineosporia sp. NBRC 101731 TaxID=3032199 RepID=UPI0024A3E9AD|nr:aminoglycoside phosphotransferase family protein [Kineosporia sp. NBRC 101731]GLY29325.1 aminoglycoside phosphotransferase [Kineosporia sp. NBRC 101731]